MLSSRDLPSKLNNFQCLFVTLRLVLNGHQPWYFELPLFHLFLNTSTLNSRSFQYHYQSFFALLHQMILSRLVRTPKFLLGFLVLILKFLNLLILIIISVLRFLSPNFNTLKCLFNLDFAFLLTQPALTINFFCQFLYLPTIYNLSALLTTT